MTKIHTDRMYEAELKHICDRFAAMGKKVEGMIELSTHSFFSNDLEAAYNVIRQDNDVDRDDIEINTLCVNVIARRQPLGPDLRLVMAIQKSVTDLERIADLCVSTAERTIELGQHAPIHFETHLKPMTESVIRMVHDAMTSFETRDITTSHRIHVQDRMVDAYYAQLFRQLLELMREDGKIVSQATRILSIMNNLERMGDHVKNISEKIAYLVTGTFAHHKTKPSQHIRGILFLCVQNSARSQMAEGLARTLLPASMNIFSAGSAPAGKVNPNAVVVMDELGIDISANQPKRITDVPLGKVDMVITLCTEEVCVNLPGIIQKRSWILPDPAAAKEADKHSAFIGIRDVIREKINGLASELAGSE
ncbi:MAG: phosphate signaling complex protein PhoU [Desulfobacteraceae bacterium]